MSGYKDLIVWQKAVDLVENVYLTTESMPTTERFGLTSQIRRAAVSIASNIAEGSKRGTDKDYRSFILIAMGSNAELETQLIIAVRLKYITLRDYTKLLSRTDEISKMLNSLRIRLTQRNRKTI